ncbi:hypothetical protein [Peterkaempfera bronchialis]|uniref:Uncharacterized protein n=1 Tax=Peterkaempfera bronchialis TaxID=2126346 RepID=A0A345SWQ2_9ACTN|nr:hypothetical protein [Peterkaempfera bronchialis]AXI78157.1 hypothetical protein C7M71_012600 [Peterkaempfera bronchialis]
MALNLDTKPPTVRSSDGIDGFQVLYPNLDAQGATAFGTAGDLLFQHPALAPYTGSGTPSRQACAELLQSQAVQMLRVEEGDRLCVETSAGRIAFIVFGKFTSGAFLGTATVWEAVG